MLAPVTSYFWMNVVVVALIVVPAAIALYFIIRKL